MKWVHAGPAQPDQVDAPRPGPVETIARGRELSSASSAERAAPEGAQTPRPTQFLTASFSSACTRLHRAFWIYLRSFSRRPSSAGTELAFAASGAGNRVGVRAGPA